MPDALESGMFGRDPAWHRKGTVIEEETTTSSEAIRLAELDWLVEERPLLVPNREWTDTEEVPTHKLLMRATDGAQLGVVGKSFVPVQNEMAFEFLDHLLDSGEAMIHTAGSLRGGKRVFMQAKLTKQYLIGGDPDERIDPFILVVNAHDGSLAFTVCNTSVRAVCENTVSAGLKRAMRTFRVRHTEGLKGKVQEARRTLRLTVGYHDLMAELGNYLITQKYGEKEAQKLLSDVVVVPEFDGKNHQAVRNAHHQREVLLSEWKIVPDLQNIRLTGWGLLQSVCRFEDWTRFDMSTRDISDDRRFERVLIEANPIKQRALSLLAPEWVGRAPRLEDVIAAEDEDALAGVA